MKAQLENGFVRIANDLLDAIIGADLTLNEMRMLWAVIRLSYGWSQKDTGRRASMENMCAITRMVERRAYYALKGLTEKALVKKGKSLHRGNVYQINTDIDTWKVELSKNSIDFLPVYSDIEPAQTSQVEPAQTSQVEPAQTSQVEPAQTSQVEPAQTSQVEPAQISQVEPAQTSQVQQPCNSQLTRPTEVPKYNIKDNLKDSNKENAKTNVHTLISPLCRISPSPAEMANLQRAIMAGCTKETVLNLLRRIPKIANFNNEWAVDELIAQKRIDDSQKSDVFDLAAYQRELDKAYGGN